ncbi:MAG: hypothetical protein ABIA04_15475 [Pseudomonadota bacterium]
MAVWSKITSGKLENFFDCSPEFYQPKYLKLSKKLRSLPLLPVGKLAYITDGEHGSPQWDNSSNIKYVTAEYIGSNVIKNGKMKTISIVQDKRNARARLQKNDVLVYSVGAYAGLTAKAEPHLFPANIPRSVAIIRLNNMELVLPGFLSIFLNCKYGTFQSIRFRAGNSQPVLALEKIKQFEIPLLDIKFQNEIDNLYDYAYEKRMTSKSLYSQAQELLEKELGLDKLVLEKTKSYETSFSEVVDGGRIDADYFQVQYLQIKNQIMNYSKGYIPLLKTVDVLAPNVDPHKTPNSRFQYVELSNINSSLGMIDGSKSLLGKDTPSRARRKVETGDILASSVVGSVEKAGIVDETKNEGLASTGFFHFRTKGPIVEYLLILIRSLIVKMQLQQESTGGILSAVSETKLKNLIIPDFSQEFQNKIAELIKKSHKAKKESEQLLEQAKLRVEELIEGVVQ